MKITDIIREVLEVDFSDETLDRTGTRCAEFLASRDEAKLTRLWQNWLTLNELISGSASVPELILLGYYLGTLKTEYDTEVRDLARLLER
ncbi:MAG: hypothetical protein HY670_10540 [Chloroflexi bacterium]|nr:hypothetical protein [Chloroflexota bacterium]